MHRCRLLQVVLSIHMEVAGVEPASSEWHIGFIPIRFQSHPREYFQTSDLRFQINLQSETCDPRPKAALWRAAILPILFYPSSVSWFSPRRYLPPPDGEAASLRQDRNQCVPSRAHPFHGACSGQPWRSAHLPCTRLDVHLAAVVSNDAGRLLPCRFAPYPFKASLRLAFSGGNSFCCSCRHSPLPSSPCEGEVRWGEFPDLLFRQATLPVDFAFSKPPPPRTGRRGSDEPQRASSGATRTPGRESGSSSIPFQMAWDSDGPLTRHSGK